MDQAKTGSFIALLRRQKGWTQRELAAQLGVTDKAISRWETGKGLPDVSLLRPLSEALGVSVNELLSGETIDPGQELAKSDALVLHTLEAAENRVRRIWRNLLYALGTVLLAGSLLFLGFDTSFVSFYGAIAGILLLAAAVFLTFQSRPKRALLAVLGVLLLAFCLLEARDYVFVKYYRLPPQYSLKIVSEGARIKYDKLFYDVYRYRSDSGKDTYVFAGNRP